MNKIFCNIEVWVIYLWTFTIIAAEVSEKYVPCHGKDETFLCMYDAKCILSKQKCDGNTDCDDGTDELHCDHVSCSGSEWFKCKDGGCVTYKFVCDGQADCNDGSDESNCFTKSSKFGAKCSDNERKCEDGLCILKSWFCDDVKDCFDGSDEFEDVCLKKKEPSFSSTLSLETTRATSVNSSFFDEILTTTGTTLSAREFPYKMFACKNGDSIPNRWLCDGRKDCPDGSDEGESCGEQALSVMECLTSKGWFHCKDGGKCINASKVCDGKKDCPNGYDEGIFCEEQSSNCSGLNCEQQCLPHPDDGPSCYCNPGYESNGSKCLDVDECKEFGVCSQLCFNSPGSYVCSCKEGYEMLSGICAPVKDDPLLIFSTKNEVRVKNLNTNRYSLTTFNVKHKTIGSATHAVGVSYDPLESRVYWSEVERNKEVIVSSALNGEDKRVVVSSGLDVPEDIAVDFLGRNIYFTDQGKSHIGVCHLSGSYCDIILKEGLDKPRAIALYNSKGLLFFSDWGKKPQIVRAGMDGSSFVPIVTKDVLWANGVAVDVALDRVFWSDAKFSWIESVKLDGSGRERLLEDHIIHPFSIAVFGDFVYWSDWANRVIQSCNKFNGKSHKYIVKEPRLVPLGIHVYHPLKEKYENNPCNPNRCSHLCLLTPSFSFVCRCPASMVLGLDKRTCVRKINHREFALVLSDGEKLSVMRPHNLGRFVDEEITFKEISQISSLTYNPIKEVLYVGSKGDRRIYEVSISNKAKKVIATGYPEDMVYDIHGNNLYWTDGDTYGIHVSGIRSGATKVLISNLDKPFAIDFLHSKKLIVFTEARDVPSVKVSDVMGGNVKALPNLEKWIKRPVDLSVQEERFGSFIYILDSYKGFIIQYNFGLQRPKVFHEKLANPSSILNIAGRLLWTEIYGLSLYWKKEGIVEYKSLDSIVTHRKPYLRLASIAPLSSSTRLDNFSSPCRLNNGGCSDLCFNLHFAKAVCMCSEGRSPSNTNSSMCHKECSEGLYHCGNEDCIPNGWRCNGVNDCKNGADELGCPMSRCSASNFRCLTSGECVPHKCLCDGYDDCEDGSDEKGCSEIKCGLGKSFCEDGKKCVLNLWICDGIADCKDKSDEKNCAPATTQSYIHRLRSNTTIDPERIEKDLEEIKRLEEDLRDRVGPVMVSEVQSSSKPWIITLVVLFLFLASLIIGVLSYFKWKNKKTAATSGRDMTLRFRNPTFGLDDGSSDSKMKSRQMEEINVLNQGDKNYNAYGNPRYEGKESNIYSELDSGDINSSTAVTIEDNTVGFYKTNDESQGFYATVPSYTYEGDEEGEESDFTSLSYSSTKDKSYLLGK